MSTVKQFRSVPDLIQMIADLENRVNTLESARSLGSASIDGGELTVRGGDIVVRNDGNEEVLRIEHGSQPRIRLTPAGTSDNDCTVHGWESGSEGAVLDVGVRAPSGNTDGGKVLMMQGATYVSHQPLVGEETYMALSEYGGHPNHISFRGKFLPFRVGGSEPWEFGYAEVGAGFGAVSFGYAYSFEVPPMVVYGITGASPNFNHCISSPTVSGFSLAWSDALAHTVSWVAIRR